LAFSMIKGNNPAKTAVNSPEYSRKYVVLFHRVISQPNSCKISWIFTKNCQVVTLVK
jgi:hypothetical protein